jgi:hypothetical protein
MVRGPCLIVGVVAVRGGPKATERASQEWWSFARRHTIDRYIGSAPATMFESEDAV